jgi:protein PsiE
MTAPSRAPRTLGKVDSDALRAIQKVFLSGLSVIEYFGLLTIGFATTFAMGVEVRTMYLNRAVTLADLLLTFLYLEVLAMVGVYFRTGKLPVRYPLYIAVVALARYLLVEIKALSEFRILAICLGIVMLGAAVWIIRHGHANYPYLNERDDDS